MDAVLTLTGGCPICGGELRGNAELKYLCVKCMVLYDAVHIRSGV
jgi:hypothetical protein